jgi:type III restriction enzyme
MISFNKDVLYMNISDIPRANMLFQIKDTKSDQLNEQVLGRVRRNPMLLSFEKVEDSDKYLFTTAYVWGILPSKSPSKLSEVILKGKEPIWGEENEVQKEIKVNITKILNTSNIKRKNTFDVKQFLENKPKSIATSNIFDTYRKLMNTPTKIQCECFSYVCNSQKNEIQSYFEFTNNLNEIKSKIVDTIANYSESIEIVKNDKGENLEVSLPFSSLYYFNQEYKTDLTNVLWRNKLLNDDEFSYDSNAEKSWLKKMITDFKIKKIKAGDEDIQLVGKNYLHNSEIKYEYYLNGNHYSYPDFILKNEKDKIFLFEVKSLNNSSVIQLDADEYEDKIKELKKFYKNVSAVVNHYFCFPILKEKTWNIFMYFNGVEYNLNYDNFKNFVNSKISIDSLK